MDALLQILKEKGRATPRELARLTGQTEKDVEAALKKYEADRVILGYQAVLDLDKTGHAGVRAVIEVRITPERDGGFDRIAARVARYPEVVSCQLMSGGYDLLITVEGPDLKQVATFVAEKLSTIQGVISTATHFQLKTYKEAGVLFLEDERAERLSVSPVKKPGDFLAEHVRAVPRSGIRDFFELVQKRGDVISLGIGEPDSSAPWGVREAAIYALEHGRTGYTSNLGSLKLRREISRYVEKVFGPAYDPDSEILVSVGVSEAIDLALRAVLNPGETVLYHEPCYVSYAPSIALAHAKGRAIHTRAESGFRLDPAEVAKAAAGAKVLLLNFPTNPTGAVLGGTELDALARVCVEKDLLVISDEIYAELTYEGRHESIASRPGMRERTILLHGLSKAFAMTGFRIGYACAPAPLIEAMMKIHQYAILCAPTPSQEAATEALQEADTISAEARSTYRIRRDFLQRRLREAGLPSVRPDGAFYLFVDVRGTGFSSRDFALRLLEEEKVAVVPGDAFGPGGEGFVRCSYATSLERLEAAADRIERFTARLAAGRPAVAAR